MMVLRAGPCAGLCAVRVLPRRAVSVVAARHAGAMVSPATATTNSRSLFTCCIRPRRAGLPRLTTATAAPAFTRPLFTLGAPVLTHYVDLPPDYEDAKGLPFRRRAEDLDAAEVANIFGRAAGNLTPAAATRLLKILHGRRVAGTLDDPAVRAATARYTREQVAAALAFLRRTVAVDEVVNAGLRAEDELAAMGVVADEGGATPVTPAVLTEVDIAQPETGSSSPWRARLFRNPPEGNNVYGDSALDKIRDANLAKALARQAEEEEKEKRRLAEEQEAAARGGPRALAKPGSAGPAGTLTLPEMTPRMQKWVQAATSDLEAPPEMPAWQRLWPSYAFGAVVVATAGAAAYFLTEVSPCMTPPAEVIPWSGASPAATATVLGLVAANVAVFVLWRVPPLWRLMNRYLLVVPATPVPASLLGAVFSHQKIGHLAANMAFLVFLGLRLHDEIGGRPAFLALYVSGGVLAFAASLTHLVLWPGQLHLTTLGASGALYAMATAYFVLHQWDGFKILGLPPDPYTGVQGLGFVGLLLVLNLLAVRGEHHKRSIDLVTHFVGMAVGGLVGERLYKRREQAEATAAAAAAVEGKLEEAASTSEGKPEAAAASTAAPKS